MKVIKKILLESKSLEKGMKKALNNTKWLRKESKQWVEDGIINVEQQEAIHTRYLANKQGNPLLIFFAVIGSLLIGTGTILVFASNWWKIPIIIRICIAFIPLLAAQGICLYTYFKKNNSTAYREGSSLFLSLSFFAALALIGQVFHTTSELKSYILICILFTLPIIYFFRGKATMGVYIIGALSVSWDWPTWVSILLLALILPFIYMELKRYQRKEVINYQLFFFTILVSNTIRVAMRGDFKALEIALVCGFSALIIDAIYRKISTVYFFTTAKLFAILLLTVTMLTTAVDFSSSADVKMQSYIIMITMTIIYIVLRYRTFTGLISTDFFATAALLLMLLSQVAGLAANVILALLGVYYIVRGSQEYALGKLNYGMALIVLIIGIRFFDSRLGLLGRGIVFIALGFVFIGANIVIARKRKELPK